MWPLEEMIVFIWVPGHVAVRGNDCFLSGSPAMWPLEEMIVFIWVPGYVAVRGNSAADSAAKDALDGDISDVLIPFSDLKSDVNKYSFVTLAVRVGRVP